MRVIQRAATLAAAAIVSCSAGAQMLEREAVVMYYHTLHAIWLMNGYGFAGGAIVLTGATWWPTP